FFCERMEVGEERCPQCKDARSWSTLSATFSMSFNAEVAGEPTQVEFAIEARALPFISISSDEKIYSELGKIITHSNAVEDARLVDGAETVSEGEDAAVEMDIFADGSLVE
ncbi:unnamed protein product, partial [Symbiodinium pilosum]